MPLVISQEDTLYALAKIEAEGLKYFNFPCPSCRRANRVNADRLKKALPNWKQLLEEKDEGGA
jgi:hypothetical protein